MFDFLFHNKRSAVRRFMSSRVNNSIVNQMRVGNRDTFRNAFCEVVWVIPCDDQGRNLEFEQARPVVTRDISPAGLSLIQSEPLTAKKVVVALDAESGRTFFACTPEHCTALGYGFHQIGLYLEEIVQVDASDADVAAKAVECQTAELAAV